MNRIEAVCFDAFDTLVHMGDMRRPHHEFVEFYTSPFVPAKLGIAEETLLRITHVNPAKTVHIDTESQANWIADVDAENDSIRLRPGAKLILRALANANIPLVIFSNYGPVRSRGLLAALPYKPDKIIVTHGGPKTHDEIHQTVASRLKLSAEQILCVGRFTLNGSSPEQNNVRHRAMPGNEFKRSLSSQPSIYAPPSIVDLFRRITDA